MSWSKAGPERRALGSGQEGQAGLRARREPAVRLCQMDPPEPQLGGFVGQSP